MLQKKPLRNALAPLLHWLRLGALTIPVLLFLHHALLGPDGYVALYQKRHEYRQELEHIQQLEAKNRQLNQSVKALRSDPVAIEGIAREQLRLTRPGEVVFTYGTPAAAPSTAAADLR